MHACIDQVFLKLRNESHWNEIFFAIATKQNIQLK